ncbi:HSP20 family protein [Bacillus niacini]|uniref:HSP20 family protein n=1 Tax=Neobacillus niacini TaxID=86668 RepID=A0A852TLW8_9BACI|nr:Hsp20/alpha crystallin family protein [Neobacillus niacini]NYE08696.1 HSP20 family protein [Neobacillus niacini]
MDIEKIRKWMEITNEYKQSDFWSSVLNQQLPKEFSTRTSDVDVPKHDIYQNDTTICILVELPGIQVNNLIFNLISKSRISIKTNVVPPISNELAMKQERYYGEISFEIDLPEPTEAHLLTVQYQDGLLYISYPRQIEQINVNI